MQEVDIPDIDLTISQIHNAVIPLQYCITVKHVYFYDPFKEIVLLYFFLGGGGIIIKVMQDSLS